MQDAIKRDFKEALKLTPCPLAAALVVLANCMFQAEEEDDEDDEDEPREGGTSGRNRNGRLCDPCGCGSSLCGVNYGRN